MTKTITTKFKVNKKLKENIFYFPVSCDLKKQKTIKDKIILKSKIPKIDI